MSWGIQARTGTGVRKRREHVNIMVSYTTLKTECVGQVRYNVGKALVFHHIVTDEEIIRQIVDTLRTGHRTFPRHLKF